jgi:hypothetical protein
LFVVEDDIEPSFAVAAVAGLDVAV